MEYFPHILVPSVRNTKVQTTVSKIQYINEKMATFLGHLKCRNREGQSNNSPKISSKIDLSWIAAAAID